MFIDGTSNHAKSGVSVFSNLKYAEVSFVRLIQQGLLRAAHL